MRLLEEKKNYEVENPSSSIKSIEEYEDDLENNKKIFLTKDNSLHKILTEKTKSLKINLMIKEKIYTLEININENTTIEGLISISIEKFNEQLKLEKSKVLLNLNIENYNITLGKKSGKPNTDMPSKFVLIIYLDFKKSEKVFNTNFKIFSLLYKDKDLIELKKKCKCRNFCIIM